MKKILQILVGVGIMGMIALAIWSYQKPIEASAYEITEIPLYIKAVNPGYKIDNISNVGEMIEIRRSDLSDAPLSLAGVAVGYTNSSGNYSKIFEFPKNSWMTGESILLRLASSPWSELATKTYTKTLAMTGGIALLKDEEMIDAVCWMGEKKSMKVEGVEVGCKKEFDSGNPTTLVWDNVSKKFEHQKEYTPSYNEKSYYEEEPSNEDEEKLANQCKGVEFSEVLSYFETEKSEQFIEIYNPKDNQILLDGCKIEYKNKKYSLSGVVRGDSYFVYRPDGFSLTKNPTNSNEIKLLDVNGDTIDTMSYPNGQRKATSYAFIGYDKTGAKIWKTTYAPTPGEPNNYQEFKTCETGKVINPATGNCVKVTSVTEKICKDGYFLNILTGRCNKIPVTTEKVCKEGYYLNPETNRCKKLQENNGADYSLEPEEYEESSSFVAVAAVLGVAGLGGIYVVYEFRREIVKLFRKVFRRAR